MPQPFVFTVKDDSDTIKPTYACGMEGASWRVSDHGARYAGHKLIDDLQLHAAKCKICDEWLYENNHDPFPTDWTKIVKNIMAATTAPKKIKENINAE